MELAYLKKLYQDGLFDVYSGFDTWEEAVKAACSPLIRQGLVEPAYADSIIENVERPLHLHRAPHLHAPFQAHGPGQAGGGKLRKDQPPRVLRRERPGDGRRAVFRHRRQGA